MWVLETVLKFERGENTLYSTCRDAIVVINMNIVAF